MSTAPGTPVARPGRVSPSSACASRIGSPRRIRACWIRPRSVRAAGWFSRNRRTAAEVALLAGGVDAGRVAERHEDPADAVRLVVAAAGEVGRVLRGVEERQRGVLADDRLDTATLREVAAETVGDDGVGPLVTAVGQADAVGGHAADE